MRYDDAVKYCEEHECEECEVYLKDLDKRTVEERYLHKPCCSNLVTDEISIVRRGEKKCL